MKLYMSHLHLRAGASVARRVFVLPVEAISHAIKEIASGKEQVRPCNDIPRIVDVHVEIWRSEILVV
jgi:hypothetical protein